MLGYTPGVAPAYLFDHPAPCATGETIYPKNTAYATSIVATSPTTVDVTYDVPVDPETVTPDGYIGEEVGSSQDLGVVGATVTGSTVTLTTAPQIPGASYELSAFQVLATDGQRAIVWDQTFSGYTPPG